MSTFTFNLTQFRKEMSTNKNSLQALAEGNAARRFNAAKEELLKEFDSSKVTVEIEGDIDASNISGTLGGKGNLFSFIGFPKGDNPTETVRQILRDETRFNPKSTSKRENGAQLTFYFHAQSPSMTEITAETPLPEYSRGRSWVTAIEKGLAGFGQYIYWKAGGRSGGGVQSRNTLRNESYTPPQEGYVSQMLKRFKERFV